MKRWNYATNTYFKTSHYNLEKAPWYVFFLRDVTMSFCDFLHDVLDYNCLGILDFITIEDRGNKSTFSEWYGGIPTLFHICICDPIFQWSWRHTKNIRIEYPYGQLKKNHPEDSNWFKQEEIESEEMRKENEENKEN